MAGHRVPVSPVAADDGTDEPVLVDGTDIGSVDKVDGPIGRNGHSFRIGQFAFASQSAAVELVARQTAFTGSNDRLPIAFRIRAVIEVPHADGLVSLRIGKVEDVVDRNQGQSVHSSVVQPITFHACQISFSSTR